MKSEPSVQQLFDLSGRVALITGASGHLGQSMANALAEAGARVIVASRKIATACKVAAALPSPRSADFSRQQRPNVRSLRMNSPKGGSLRFEPLNQPGRVKGHPLPGERAGVRASVLSTQTGVHGEGERSLIQAEVHGKGRGEGEANRQHLAIAMDHMDESSINAGFDNALRQAGKVDVLVCNGHEALGKDLRSVTQAEFNRQLQNATGYFLLARKFHDHVVRQRSQGSIIMIGSMYGIVGSYPESYAGIGPANPVAYQALKGGIIQMVRHLAVYWAPDGIRVNCLSPGPFPSSDASPALVRRLKEHSPMRRMGRSHELKGSVVFLASDASSYVTGHNLLVDGGWTAW